MADKLKNISSRLIIASTAVALVLSFVFSGLYGYITEAVARKNGSLNTMVFRAEDFVWNGIDVRDNKIITTDHDPQMTLEYNGNMTGIRFYMEYSVYPGEMVAYYTEPGDEGFSVKKRLWIKPLQNERNWYVVETGMKNITSLRIDPTMYAGNILEFGDFIINEEKSLADYFKVSYGDVFNLILYTGIISSVLKFLQEMIKKEFD